MAGPGARAAARQKSTNKPDSTPKADATSRTLSGGNGGAMDEPVERRTTRRKSLETPGSSDAPKRTVSGGRKTLDVDNNDAATATAAPASPRAGGRSHGSKAPRTPAQDSKQQQRARERAASRAQMTPEQKDKEAIIAAKKIQQSFRRHKQHKSSGSGSAPTRPVAVVAEHRMDVLPSSSSTLASPPTSKRGGSSGTLPPVRVNNRRGSHGSADAHLSVMP